MFSFKKGRRIAFIKGGKLDGKFIRVDNVQSSKCCQDCGKCSSKKACCKISKKGGCSECGVLKNMISMGGDDSLAGFLLQQELKNVIKDERKMINIDDGTLIPMPNPKQRECLYIGGPSGSGKSTYASNYIKIWRYMFPKRNFFLFSNVEKDPCLDKLKPTRIKLDASFVDEPLNTKLLANSICLFDDVDFIKDKAIRKSVTDLRDSLLGEGRHENIYVITTNHVLTDGNKTKFSLVEATAITMFPATDTYHVEQVLKRYCGFGAKVVKHIQSLNSRWVTVSKRCPTYVMHEHGVFFPSEIK